MAGGTNVGRVRSTNQDSYIVHEERGTAIVADGIGGRKGGKTASSMAVEFLEEQFAVFDQGAVLDVGAFLLSRIDQVNRDILTLGESNEKLKGMGTTLEMMAFKKNRVFIGHLGDSRTYLYYKKHFWTLTIDHNIRTFLARNLLRKENLQRNYNPSALVKALGLAPQCSPDIFEKIVQDGEIYLSASDGLFDMVDDQKICRIVHQNQEKIDDIPKILIDEALRGGGKDNVTVVVAKVIKS